MSNLVHRRRRCARIVPYMILCLEGSTPKDRCLFLFIALRWMQEPGGGDDVGGGKYPSLLEDFQTGTASMARKRHLASTARGFYCFCLMTHKSHPFYPSNPW